MKLTDPQMDDTFSNEITIVSYELGVQEYTAGTPSEITGNFKIWIDAIIQLLPPHAKIIEIGSAFGRDAQYIESHGFRVERTDATLGFVSLLQQKGFSARKFNILTDDFTSKYDLVFANAVFLHFTPQELQKALSKIHTSLNTAGILAFSVKKGEGEEWTQAKLGKPRYFCYWNLVKLNAILELIGFEIINWFEDEKFLQIIAKVTS